MASGEEVSSLRKRPGSGMQEVEMEVRRKRDLEQRKFHKIFLRSFEYFFAPP